jgi:DNA-binding beta-propeller fold protein YncE
MTGNTRILAIAAIAWLAPLVGSIAHAQLVVSANDAKAKLVDGVNTTVPTAPPDTVTVLDFRTSPPRVVAQVDVPNSVVGPPQNIAVTPDRSLLFITSSTKIDPADPAKTTPDDRMTVVDLKAKPPAVLATLRTGKGPSGVAINPTGTLAIVTNRTEGTLSVYTIKGKNIASGGKIDLGAPQSEPSGVVFIANGRGALVTRNADHKISWLTIDGARVQVNPKTLEIGPKPYPIDVTPLGDMAVVGTTGAGPTGAEDIVAVIDLTSSEPKVAKQIAAGSVVEGVAISPNGRYVAATVMNGSNLSKKAPLYNDFGRLRIFGLSGGTLEPITEVPIGHWCQGVAWVDSRTVLAQCMVEQEILTFRFDGRVLISGTTIKVNGGPAALKVIP